MKLIVGLGNVGKEYENTRHNVGFMVLDSLGLEFSLEKKFQAYVAEKEIKGEKCLFLKPTTYMNLSGLAVQKVSDYYHISLNDILIIQDDLDLPFGKIKIKSKGSSGGHNGLKSIFSSLHSEEIARLKIGISHDKEIDTVDYVLGHFSAKEVQYFDENKLLFANIIESFVFNGIEKTMSLYNTR